jgi:TAT-translocated FGD2 family F420-dependent dehydrogenase
MGTGVTCPTYRYNPAIVAQSFASLGILYPGRVFLGVGTGEALNEQAATGDWGEYEERAERLVEAIELIRELWTGEQVEHKGPYYNVNARLYDVPDVPVPIYIAASGPESMHLAGKYGDGLITDGESAIKPELRKEFERGAKEAGKDPAELSIVAEIFVHVGERAEAAKLAELWRFLPKAWEKYVEDPDPTHIRRQAEKEVPIDDVLAKWKIGSDPRLHIDALQELVDGGVSTIFVHSADPDQEGFIDFYAKKVLPKVKR